MRDRGRLVVVFYVEISAQRILFCPVSRSHQLLVLVSCNWVSALVAPSGECLWGEGLVWLIGAVVC